MKKILSPIVMLLAFTACKTTETVDLKFNMPKGSRYEYTTSADMTMNQEMMGQQMTMKNKMTFVYLFEVANDSAGWKTVTTTINRVKMDISSMGMNMSVDTDNPSADTSAAAGTMNKVYAAMKGKQFSFTINDKGEIGSISGMKEMMQGMFENDPQKEQIQAQLNSSFNEESFKQNLQQSFSVYPGKPVKVGESWKNSTSVNNQGMTVKSDNTYTLESVKGDEAIIKQTSVMSSPQSVIQGLTVSMKGSNNGKFHYNTSNGLPATGELKMIMDMEMSAQGQKIPMKTETIINISSKKL